MIIKSKTTKQHKSLFQGEAKLELDEKTKKILGDFVKKSKKQKIDPSQHSQTIICGREEFAASEKSKKKPKT